MKNTITYKVMFICLTAFFCYSLKAQQAKTYDAYQVSASETNKRESNYQKLKKLGYSEKEIFEDLGNANFLLEKYETAVFWYKKLKAVSDYYVLSDTYNKRYQYALEQTIGANTLSGLSSNTNWINQIKKDYELRKKPYRSNHKESYASKYKEVNFQQNRNEFLNDEMLVQLGITPSDANENDNSNKYKAPIALTPNGKTAYFSKAVYIKPAKGIFSKKELIHKIYKADKIDGQWQDIREVALAPKHASVLHPAISDDGKRLFFASNMPGTFGDYDIYVANLYSNDRHGVAKNLGEKVNTKKDDLYPNFVGDNTLVFASEGHKGHGGLDVFMTQVGERNVDLAVNLGSDINSSHDDYSIYLMTENGVGYVMSNRGKENNAIQRVAFSYANNDKLPSTNKPKYELLEAFNSQSKTNYASSVFEDE